MNCTASLSAKSLFTICARLASKPSRRGFCLIATIKGDNILSATTASGRGAHVGTIMLIRRAEVALKAAISALILAVSVTGAVAGLLEDAEAAFRRGDYGAAMRISRPLADKGDARFQFLLGEMYQHGWGTPQDYAAAVSWFRKAADQGDASSQYELGRMYVSGRGVPQDETQGTEWTRKAADQGHAGAQALLAAMYATGQGVPQDYTVAAS